MNAIEAFHNPRCRQAISPLMLAALLALPAGCATPPPADVPAPAPEVTNAAEPLPAPAARVEIPPQAQADFAEGVRLLTAGEYDKGIALLKSTAGETKDFPAPLINLGMAYARTGELKQAETYFMQALELDPDNPVAGNEYAILKRKTGRFGEARQLYEKMLKEYPRYYLARRNLGVLCDLYLRDLECAIKQYQAYSKAFPDNREVQKWIADLKQRMEQQE